MLVMLLTTEVAILPLGRAAEWNGQHRDSLRKLQARAGQHSDLHQDDFEEGCHLHSRSGSYHSLHSSSITDFPSDSSCGDMNWMPLFLRGKIKKILNFMIILLLPLYKNTIWFFSKYLRKPAPKRVAFTYNG